ncbi:AAA family ATPase [Halalkalibacter akibai]|uniref:AAA+ ATPase domain-containing protein n=1 Tax=Halalkalibacter akibai (strain ATCC 43226 / DSM 21942 / CIP 109018 / JCM 9157 / 1139) TaxID=1236973 RepID=W4QUX6_HALA3|nr:AAA family ATPase [Halalkalibacter akibai]GAE35732.1 hypothetical protein JCM9157_2860 [Halalkalibacter akibai JCM 9157]
MLQQKWTIDKIQDWLEKIDKGMITFQEGKAWEILWQLDQVEWVDGEQSQHKAQLFAMLAKARYDRIGKIDPLVERWTNEALQKNHSSVIAHELRVEMLINFLKSIPIPNKFPPIRETDHSSAKKQTAKEYEEIAERFFNYYETYKEMSTEVQDSLPFISENSNAKLKLLSDLIEQFQSPFDSILKAVRQYASSVQGVYYSATQFQEVAKATSEIEQLMGRWNAERANELQSKEQSALQELKAMIGLEEIKERVRELYQFLHYQKERMRQGFQAKDSINLHMILQGNPGTGKTHLARLIAKIYNELGLLDRDEVHEVDRSRLVGAFVGQTEENTLKAIEEAKGGVLFIDEAYTLKRTGAAGNDYGQTVIDTLVSAMTSGKYAGTFAVILAGYPEEMRSFLRANPGLRSRFPDQNQLELVNYSLEELVQIGEQVAIENDYILTIEAKREFMKRIEKAQVDESFGNARTAKNIILDAIFQKGARMSLENPQTDDFVFLEANDFKGKSPTKIELSARDELDDLIGLEQVKKEINQLTSFVHIQQLRREKGMKTLPLQVHSVFTGNPGTGKTTVAKLYAKSLREIGLLKRGHLVVVSRADLVAGYVGQTAQKTKEKVKDAVGGVLFIDEAYSLLSKGQGDFGKEVINTLIQQMTEYEENLAVVLAGYGEEMEELLSSNPGLRSRFKKHISFPDYGQSELLKIILLRANHAGYQFGAEVKETLTKLLPEAGHAGNGRFAVDIFDQLAQTQSLRLSDRLENEQLDVEELSTIKEEDVLQVLGNRGI